MSSPKKQQKNAQRAKSKAKQNRVGKPAKASAASGWLLNDVIRVPSAACPAQQAVVRIWRKDEKVAPPKADAQGRSRIYLKDGMDAARAGNIAPIPMFAAAMTVEGKPCR